MNNMKTIVVIGGGYAGINLIKALKKEFHSELNKSIRIILVDQNTFHFKKVKLFKGIVEEDVSNLYIPLNHYCGSDIEFIQGELNTVNHQEQTVHITKKDGVSIDLPFDRLVLAMGSVGREMSSDRGGITLSHIKNAKIIRHNLLQLIKQPKKRLRVAIVGSGISGIETAAEVEFWLNNEMKKEGIKSKDIEIYLINNKPRLLEEVPLKVSERLENKLLKRGIQLLHNQKAERFSDGKVVLSDQSELEVDECIWTIGLNPCPSLHHLGISLTDQGKIKVDSWYRLFESQSIYAIGDCVHVVDPINATPAGMSCKEAISQANRLSKIIKEHLEGVQANAHKTYPDLLCIGLGPNDGFVWANKWGVDFILSGRLAEKIREYTWDVASMAH